MKDPYGHIPQEEKFKVTSYVPREEAVALRTIRFQRGTTQTVINMLLQPFVEGLKNHGITEYTQREQFEQYVERCAAALFDLARSNRPDAGHDGGGAERVRKTSAGKPRKSPNNASKRKKGNNSTKGRPERETEVDGSVHVIDNE